MIFKSFSFNDFFCQSENFDFYFTNYKIIEFRSIEKGKKITLGNKEDKKCRFCKKESPEVTFKKKAHAFLESIGNRSLFTFYECDTCNETFSKSIEDDFGKFSHFWRALSQVHKKKKKARKTPTFKRNDIEIRSESENNFLEIKTNKKIENGVHNFEPETEPFFPVGVYKCLCKMALTTVPENKLNSFKDTFKWLLDITHSNTLYQPKLQLRAYINLFPFKKRSGSIEYVLLERNNYNTNSPQIIFLLFFSYYAFQVFLPFSLNDAYLYSRNNIVFDSILYGENFKFKSKGIKIKTRHLDLSSNKRQTTKLGQPGLFIAVE